MTQEEAEVVLKVNSQEARQKLEDLEKKAKDLRRQWADAYKKGDTRGISQINKELSKVNKEVTAMRTNAANIEAAMKRLDKATPKEIQRTIKMINAELSSGKVARGSKEWDMYVAKLKTAKTELGRVKAEMEVGSNGGWVTKLKEGLTSLPGLFLGAVASITGLVAAGKEAVKAYAGMQQEEVNVQKYTKMTNEEVAKLNEEFKKLDTRTSREQLNKLAQDAGRLGKKSVEDVLGFVKAADQLNVALEDLGDGATLTLTKLTGIFGIEKDYGTEESLLKVGSVINELSQNCSASAPYLAEFSSRLGGIAAQSKMSISEIMAFAAVLDTQNLNVEASATAVGQLITKMYQDPAKIAKAAKLDVEEFTKLVRSDMNSALLTLFEQLNQFGGMESLATIFDEMGTDGARAIPVLSALAGHIDELRGQEEAAATAFREGTSVTIEFDKQNNSVQAGLDKSKNALHELVVGLGEELLPVVQGCMSVVQIFVKALSSLVIFIKENHRVIISATAGIAAYTIAVNWATIAAKAHGIAEKARAAAIALSNSVVKTATVLGKGLQVVYYSLIGATEKATIAQTELKAAMAGTPWGAIAIAVGVAITAFMSLGDAVSGVNDTYKILNDGQAEAIAKKKEEETLLQKAITTIKTFNGTKDEEKTLIGQLNDKYGGFFGKCKTLNEWYLLLTQRGDEYTESIYKQIVMEAKRQQALDLVKKAEEERRIARDVYEATQVEVLWAYITDLFTDKSWDYAKRKANAPYEDNRRAWADYYEAEAQRLLREAQEEAQQLGNPLGSTSTNTGYIPGDSTGVGGSTTGSNTNKGGGAATTHAVEPKDTQKEKEDEIKTEVKKLKVKYEEETRLNRMAYANGVKDYSDYIAQKDALDAKYLKDRKAIYEEYDEKESDEYRALLNEEAKAQEKALEATRANKLSMVEKTHSDNTDSITSNYLTPGNDIFQNKKAFDQALLDEDIRYLRERQKLFAKDSPEWGKAEEEINERVKQDKLDKQKETAEAYSEFEKKYRKASGSDREKYEIEIMGRLHEQGLISEEEYQKAVKDIKKKYQDEDRANASEVYSDYTDMLDNLVTSWSDFFDQLGQKGSNFWDNLSKCAESTYALMGAFLSQYSALANAERDLELAKIEKRYSDEISAAGKNEKKKAKLEKQKAAEVAKVKNKYNEKSMAIELAQAYAMTATSAINAYASAAAIPVTGYILAPIAAAMATAAGLAQVAIIKKQHEAQALGFYEGGFTSKDGNNRKEVGVVHANEFVANHEAVNNPAIAPILRLIDTAQKNNTIGRLTFSDISNAIGQRVMVREVAELPSSKTGQKVLIDAAGTLADAAVACAQANRVLADQLGDGIEAYVVMDGENGLYSKYNRYQKLLTTKNR